MLLGIYRLTSCGGCVQTLFDQGDLLLQLPGEIEVRHFPEAGPQAPGKPVDVAVIEGGVSTPEDLAELRGIRERTGYLISIGACATAGGIQALRNLVDVGDWFHALYPHPEFLESLDTAKPVSAYVSVDLELWGCPIDSGQLPALLRDLARGIEPRRERESLCMECQRSQRICTLVARGQPCLGPVTRGGCGALCPSFGRACYACFGPADTTNSNALGRRVEGLGLLPEDFARRLRMINGTVPAPQPPAKGSAREKG